MLVRKRKVGNLDFRTCDNEEMRARYVALRLSLIRKGVSQRQLALRIASYLVSDLADLGLRYVRFVLDCKCMLPNPCVYCENGYTKCNRTTHIGVFVCSNCKIRPARNETIYRNVGVSFLCGACDVWLQCGQYGRYRKRSRRVPPAELRLNPQDVWDAQQ